MGYLEVIVDVLVAVVVVVAEVVAAVVVAVAVALWRNSAYSHPAYSGPVAYLEPHNRVYLCRAVFNPINVRIHLPLSPLPTPCSAPAVKQNGSIQ